ncbi:hypothetical protein [Microbacterium sp. SCN 69-37]|uniref:hypothetical protein n=1 Tax=Microbacterium sp. SCN 69-37 TaxID=1660115 RepID=UPI00086A6F5A|nr:hypothetical protein [Microbacterium sp. SCN 69-37]ODT24735.1 MAG: hypothetical protein ABS64_04815 [Microbacterium sp. SCN 69-37]
MTDNSNNAAERPHLLPQVPAACTLTPGGGRAQIERWRAFDRAHLIDIRHEETRLVARYARTSEAARLLRELVATERACCSFVTWDVQDEPSELVLIVTGSPEQLSAVTLVAN